MENALSLRAAALLMLLLAAGCMTTTKLVPAPRLAPLWQGAHSRELLLQGIDRRMIALGPQSLVCIRRLDGAQAPCLRASQLRVGPRGLRATHPVPLELADAARVRGLSPRSLEALNATCPAWARLTLASPAGEEVVVEGQGDYQGWLEAFLERVAENNSPDLQRYLELAPLCQKPNAYWLYSPCAMRKRPSREELLGSLMMQDVTPLLGRWQFHVLPQGWLPEKPLLAPAHEGKPPAVLSTLAVEDGIAYEDIGAALVRSYSARKMALVTGIVAGALVSTAVFGRLGAAAAVAGANSVDAELGISERPSALEPTAPRLWRPGAALPPASRPLFTLNARRRAIMQLVVAGDLGWGLPLNQRSFFSTGGMAALRWVDVFELGGGVRYLRIPIPGEPRGYYDGALGYLYLGGHYDLDLRRRVALALSLDMGGAGDLELHVRLRLGVRLRVAGPWFLGLAPFSPTYNGFRPGPNKGGGGWSFLTALESGVAF